MKKVLFYLFTLLISTNIVFAEHLDNEMNVMSFNIRMSTKSDGANWWEYRKDLAANVIKFYDVDMFGAQEVLHNQLTDLQKGSFLCCQKWQFLAGGRYECRGQKRLGCRL